MTAAAASMRAAAITILVLLSAAGSVQVLAAESGGDGIVWLKKIAAASRQVNYAGTFVYQHGRKMETSRIAHWADANGERERLETLDGPAREIIRNNDNVTCYQPESKKVTVEKRSIRQFPAMLPEQLSGITENRSEERRVGKECA